MQKTIGLLWILVSEMFNQPVSLNSSLNKSFLLTKDMMSNLCIILNLLLSKQSSIQQHLKVRNFIKFYHLILLRNSSQRLLTNICQVITLDKTLSGILSEILSVQFFVLSMAQTKDLTLILILT
jgi:hypothetical protein